jgi:transcriptional regulator with XRE-family HTH domain
VAQQGERSSGVAVLDALIDGVRVGDNLVVLLPAAVGGGWLVDRYTAAAAADRLVVVDAEGRHAGGSHGRVLPWSAVTDPARARAELLAADEAVGTDARFVFDSLSALASSWGHGPALDLFLWACPRLYRRRSIALWAVDADQHDDAFVRRLTAITQVVVTGRTTEEGLRLQVVKADGRDSSVIGRAVVAQLVDGDLVGARPVDAERHHLGERLRELRTRRGVGQADLARRVGISPSALSQAERGVRAVSAETLLRILEALGLPVDADDLAERGYRVHRRGGQAASQLASGVTGRRRAEGPDQTIWQLAFDPRASGRGGLFPAKAVETVVVLRGVLQLELSGGVETLLEGDALVAERAHVAAWGNPSDTVTEAVWIVG